MMISLTAAESSGPEQSPNATVRTEKFFPHLVVGGGSNVILAVQNLGSKEVPFSLAVMNPGSTEVSCEMTLYTGSQGNQGVTETLAAPPLSQTSFYTDQFFGYEPGFWGGLVAVCESRAVAYSLQQDRLTGDTHSVGVECFDLP